MFGAVAFLPLYQQTVQGASATNSGLLLLPMMLGVMVVSVVVGPDHHQDRQVPDLPDHRRRRHDASAMLLLTRLDVDTSKTESRSTWWCSASAWAS